MMDNVKKLYDIWLNGIIKGGRNVGPWLQTHPDEFVIWLADKLEELREDKKGAKIQMTKGQDKYLRHIENWGKDEEKVCSCAMPYVSHPDACKDCKYKIISKGEDRIEFIKWHGGEEKERAGGSWESKDYEMAYKDGEVNIDNCVIHGYSSLATFEAAELDEYPMLVFRKPLASKIAGCRALVEEIKNSALAENEEREKLSEKLVLTREEAEELYPASEVLDEWPKRFCIEGPTDQELRDWGSKPRHDANGCRFVELDEKAWCRIRPEVWKIKEYMPRP
jgi:hypothetical protein